MAEQFSDSQYLDMDLLRFTTAGSVDDGKSTLIGRLLYDSKSIFEDQLDSIEQSSKNRGDEHTNLALLTDGLKDEREQGITIDVAYRYFATPKRKFIIADTPGHIQYTRNMVTGASTANLAIILIDARKGVIEQTKRHSYIASLLQIKHVVVCVNKMDLVDFDEKTFKSIQKDYEAFSSKLDIADIHYIPISALLGDNVVTESEKTPWYNGGTLIHTLENVHVASDLNHTDFRFPVQSVIRPHSDEYHDYRGYAGKLEGGVVKVGDQVTAMPSGFSSKIKTISTLNGDLDEAFAPMSVSLTLEDEIDITRGDMIVHSNNLPRNEQDVTLMMCWMNQKPLNLGGVYTLKHTTNETRCKIKTLENKVDINNLEEIQGDQLGLNEIGKITIRTMKPLFFDKYKISRGTGSVILVDEATNETVGAGMIV